MAVKIDLSGEQFGDLTVIGIAEDIPGKKKKWYCKCKCGEIRVVAGSNLRSGHTRHCEKCGYKSTRAMNTIHGMVGTKLYGVWNSMRNRCNDKNTNCYHNYGGRGIRVCEKWEDANEFIKWALKSGYKEGYELDRINNNGNYCPKNCHWILRQENANNKRNNKLITYNGETKTLANWARYFGVNYKNLSRNLIKGYSLPDAVERLKSGDRTHRGSKAWLEKRK